MKIYNENESLVDREGSSRRESIGRKKKEKKKAGGMREKEMEAESKKCLLRVVLSSETYSF